MGALSLALQYALNVNMSVAIVAMVKHTGQLDQHNSSKNVTELETCPGILLQSGEDQEGEFEWSDVTQGQILASYYYGYIMTQILGGYLAGRFGGKYVLGGGIFASGIITMLFPILSRLHVYALITARIMQGAFQVSYQIPVPRRGFRFQRSS
ncbi:unnamed protein product [Timema podura]|uniref:Major facilitator superfamily (MFS) profile domain-containing protein n=1 Tax=Timema podura TaxID=61482 RepID=A0ABN7NYP3_TIMPD|nr:unnamed protein product [Timema podura]